MRVISWKPLREFAARYRDAEVPLRTWFKLLEASKASNFSELKRTFGTVDYVPINQREIYVFDVGGNKYRVVSEVKFKHHLVFIQFALTHPEYDSGQWKNKL